MQLRYNVLLLREEGYEMKLKREDILYEISLYQTEAEL